MALTGRLGTTDSQLGNILLGSSGEELGGGDFTFVADAILFKTIAFSFAADSILLTEQSDSILADAVIVGGFAGQFTADAVIFAEVSNDFTADSVFVATIEVSFTADSELAAAPAPASAFQPTAFQTTAFQTYFPNPTFVAKAIIFATLEHSFSADALLIEPGQKVFGAEAYLIPALVIDNFNNRTTTGGDPGQPSDVGFYYVDEDWFTAGGVDNGVLYADPDFEQLGTRFFNSADDVFVQFDFKVEAEAFYQFFGKFVPSIESPGRFNLARLDIGDTLNGDGTWEVLGTTVAISPYIFSPANGEFWTVKAYLSTTTLTGRLKVWRVGDPEPNVWHQEFVGASQWTEYTSTFDFESQIWLYSGPGTTPAQVDNLVIGRLSGSGINSLITADAVVLRPFSFAFTADASIIGPLAFDFTADAVLQEFTGTYQWGFTADAVIIPDTHIHTFTADAYLVQNVSAAFTANSRLVSRVSSVFTADSWLQGRIDRVFTANAWLRREPAPQALTIFRKSITISISQKRPTPLSAFVPPRNPDSERETGNDGPWNILDPDCLPPCEGYGAGPGSIYGANGAVIRRTIIYCDSCGVWYYTDNNKLGIGEGTTSGHAGCEATHNKNLHEARIFADYSSIPELTTQMRAKLLWDIDAPSGVVVKVYANSYLPPLSEDGEFQSYNTTWDNDYWSNGNYIGSLSFTATNSSVAEGVQWCDLVASLTVVPDSLSTDVFRFEIGDLSTYYGAEFRAPNVPVTVD